MRVLHFFIAMLRKHSNKGFAPSRAGSSLYVAPCLWDKDYSLSVYCACEAGLLLLLDNTVLPTANMQILQVLLLELWILLPCIVWAFPLPWRGKVYSSSLLCRVSLAEARASVVCPHNWGQRLKQEEMLCTLLWQMNSPKGCPIVGFQLLLLTLERIPHSKRKGKQDNITAH